MQAFLQNQANANLLLLFAFHVGEVRSRAIGKPAKWATWQELIDHEPGMEVFGEGFHSCVVQMEPGVFLPLVSIVERLFEGPDEKSVRFSAGVGLRECEPLAQATSGFLNRHLRDAVDCHFA